MKDESRIRSCLKILAFALILGGGFSIGGQEVSAAVPIRISIKFIVDANANRPTTGRLNTDTEILNEVKDGLSILRENITEFVIDELELYDLAGVSQWYAADAVLIGSLRTAATNAPATYDWRTDAINIYINAGSNSAYSNYPPDNDIIFMNQYCGNTPSCILHEMGHSLNLFHTHDSDACADTLLDNQAWTSKDQMAQNSFAKDYTSLTAAEKDQVDRTWNNIMSYHVGEPQRRITACQMNRISNQADADRNWLLTKIPIYVDWTGQSNPKNGRWNTPYVDLQQALNAGGLSGKVLVLQQGSYTITQSSINANVEIVTRSGPSDIHNGVRTYMLPTDLENSKNSGVRTATRKAQNEDTAARKVLKEARKAEEKATRKEEKAKIRAAAQAEAKGHMENAMGFLLEAANYAEGDELLAIQMELAERYRDEGDHESAIRYFTLVLEGTDQDGLKRECLMNIQRSREKIEERIP